MHWTTRCYRFSWTALQHLYELAGSVHAGLWLGLLSRNKIERIDEAYYSQTGSSFQTNTYNLQGLFNYETMALNNHLQNSGKILIAGAGAGREVIALRRMHLEAIGFECNTELLQTAKRILSEEDLPTDCMVAAPRNGCPELDTKFDVLWLGWGLYSYIQGKQNRIAFLRSLQKQLQAEASVFVSYHPRLRTGWKNRITWIIGTTIRRLTFRPPVEIGDMLSVIFIHEFTQDEIRDEFLAAGFQLQSFHTELHGTAVGKRTLDS